MKTASPSLLKSMDLRLGSLTQTLERQIGFPNMVDLFDKLRAEYPEPVGQGQRFIRESDWGPESGLSKSMVHENLLQLESVHQDFIKTGGWLAEQLLEKIEAGHFLDPAEILTRIYNSERARGSVGKSSSFGLDALRDSAEEQIESMMDRAEFSEDDKEMIWSRLPLLPADVRTAESQEERLFEQFVEQGGEPLDRDNLERVDLRTDGKASRLLRDFLRYDLDEFNAHLELLSSDFEGSEETANRADSDGLFLVQVSDEFGDEAERFREAVHTFSSLAGFDLSVEAKYGFKSSFGILHVLCWSEVCKVQDPLLLPSTFTRLRANLRAA
jgi:hypothetical protein